MRQAAGILIGVVGPAVIPIWVIVEVGRYLF